MRRFESRRRTSCLILGLIAVFVTAGFVDFFARRGHADDWPTYRHDQRRSGMTSEQLKTRRLELAWHFGMSQAPSPAWPDAARWDAYAGLEGLRSMRNYDPVLHPVIVGKRLYLPGNSDDTVRCLDLETGNVVWRFTADGPVRVAPTVFGERVYFGSDDGSLYAVDAATGKLGWRQTPGEQADQFLNDGRLISTMPIRTGVLVDPEQGLAIVSAGLFPWRSSMVMAYDLQDGEQRWQRELGTGWTIEGSMLLSSKHLIVPQGRAPPQLFDRQTGAPVGALPGGGGSFVMLTDDEQVMHGPGNKAGWITATKADSREKVATFEKGTAVVVHGETAYLLDPEKLAAFERTTGQVLWTQACPASYELILAGRTLFVGGSGQVIAHDAVSGERLWSANVRGRAQGLAVANEALVVSTDTGDLYCFRGTAPQDFVVETTSQASGVTDVPRGATSPALSRIDDPDLLDRWVFHADQVAETMEANSDSPADAPTIQAANLAQGEPAVLPHGSRIVTVGDEHALLLDGSVESVVAEDYKSVSRPTQAMTVSGWFRIDKPQPWGGLLSMTQDNGAYEKGWILGYRGDQFGIGLNGKGGPDRLTWLAGESSRFAPKSWHHLAGTYDGRQLSFYMDGKLVATSQEQSGPINYPPKAGYYLGTYRDDDEHYATLGMVNEVRLYQRVLDADEIKQLHAEKASRFPEAAEPLRRESVANHPWRGPIMRFGENGQAVVKWETLEPQPSRLEILSGGKVIQEIVSDELTRQHEAKLPPLPRDVLVNYRVRFRQDEEDLVSSTYECDRHFDYVRQPLPRGDLPLEIMAGSRQRLRQANLQPGRGIAVVVGAKDKGVFAEALRRTSGYDVIAWEPDEELRGRAQRRLIEAGVYGRNVCVLAAPSPGTTGPLTRFADLVVWAQSPESELKPDELNLLLNQLMPGGRAILGVDWIQGTSSIDPEQFEVVELDGDKMLMIERRKFKDAAGWTHMYGSTNNSAFAGEGLSGVRRREDLRIAWAGRPGPRYQSDRGNRKPSPLAVNGRLYMQGLHRIIAVNAYNGTILWSLELPEVARFNVPRDCSNWCADEHHVYVAARDRILVLDGKTGSKASEFDVYDPGQAGLEWGYVARFEGLLLGSGVRQGTMFTGFWGGEHWYDSKDGEHAKKVCSEHLFARDADSGAIKWTYEGGLIVNPTITMTNGRIHFLECRSEQLVEQEERRLDGEEFWNHLFMVALDARTGQRLWEMPAKPMPGQSALYMAASDDTLLLQTSQGGAFALYAFDAATGEQRWRGKYDWETDHHGKHLSRPAIVGDKIYLRPLTIDINDGSVLAEKFPAGHQCGTYTASQNALFLRAGSLAVWDRDSGKATRWDRARPDCWISTIPALGMLLSPEGGGGCSCGGWIETSMGFAPVEVLKP